MMRALLALAFCMALLLTACYDRPTCSFRCGPNNECPYEYTCASDGWCKLKGTADDQLCTAPDAQPPDAEPEADAEE